MPWIKKISQKKIHSCLTPTSPNWWRNMGMGSIWQCPKCQKQWIVKDVYDSISGPFFEWELFRVLDK